MNPELEIDSLRRELAELRRQFAIMKIDMATHRQKSDHPYHPHGRYHVSSDRPYFIMVPVHSGTPSPFPDDAMFYDTSDNSLKIRVNGTTKESGAFS